MTTIDLEREFGKDYKEKMVKAYISEFATDDETKALFEELCEELDDSDLLDDEVIEKVRVLPYNMSYAVIHTIKNRNADELMSLLRKAYYADFIKDVNSINESGETKFEARYKKFVAIVSDKVVKRFENVRLLTREELQVLISLVESKSGEKLGLDKFDYEFYKGDNKYCKHLISAHKAITKSEHGKVRAKVIQENKKQYLKNIIQDLKQNKKSLGC